MNQIKIYYFSGTGNTAFVAEHVKESLAKRVNQVELVNVEGITSPIDPAELKETDIIGLCFPVYAFSAPAIIKNFISFLPDQNHMPMFHIKTAGGTKGLTQYASSGISRKLKKKGYVLTYDRTVTMGSNWAFSYDDRLVKQLAIAAKDKAESIAEDITKGVSRTLRPNIFQSTASDLVSYGEHRFGAQHFGKSLRATEDCNGCKLCQENCPQENIQMVDRRPVFGADCMWCMRCIYACPQKAIFSKQMQFAILEDGYNLKKVLSDDQISADFVDAETTGEFADFYPYFNDKNR